MSTLPQGLREAVESLVIRINDLDRTIPHGKYITELREVLTNAIAPFFPASPAPDQDPAVEAAKENTLALLTAFGPEIPEEAVRAIEIGMASIIRKHYAPIVEELASVKQERNAAMAQASRWKDDYGELCSVNSEHADKSIELIRAITTLRAENERLRANFDSLNIKFTRNIDNLTTHQAWEKQAKEEIQQLKARINE